MGDPERIGDYAIARRLGSGGQGVVYEAYGQAGERVALKVLHPQAALRRPFDKEVNAARRVAAFCTARIVAAELDGAQPYVVSEYVAGPSLRAAVDERGPYTGDDLRRLAIGTATAMAAIHDAGVAHCDLKPENVLLGPDGPRVIDFGIARVVDNSLTAARGVMGTPGYMAPELFSGGAPGPASDVFAWGAVIVFAATGKAPFAKAHVAAVIYDVLRAEVNLDALQEPLRGLVAASLAKVPSARPSARDLLLGLLGGGQPDLLDAGSREAAGVPGGSAAPALGVRAEAAFASLSPAEQELADQALLRMVGPGDGLVGVRPDELDGMADTTVEPVIEALEAGGVIHEVPQGGFTLTNAALIRAWPRLGVLVANERGGLATYQRLRTAAANWHAHGRREGDLHQGVALEQALAWSSANERRIALNPVERDFLARSSGLVQRRTRRRRALTAALVVLTVSAVALAGLSEINSRAAQQAERRATARGLAARAETLRDSDPAAALLLSVAAARSDPGADAERAVLGSLAQPDVVRRSDPSIGVGADGRTLILPEHDVMTISDAVTRERLARVPGADSSAWFAYLSADRSLLATQSCQDPNACDLDPRVVTVRRVATGEQVGERVTMEAPGGPLVFDGQALLRRDATCGSSPLVAGEPAPGRMVACVKDMNTFGLVDARTGRVLSSRRAEKDRLIHLAHLSQDGRLLATLWTRAFPGPHGYPQEITGVDLWSVEGGRLSALVARGELPSYDFPKRGSGTICLRGQLAFSPSGTLLAIERCGLVTLWGNVFNDETRTGNPFYDDSWPPATVPLELLSSVEQPMNSALAFTADGGLLTVLGGGELRVTDTSPFAHPPLSLGPVRSAAFSPDGRVLAVMDDRRLRLVDVASGRVLHTLTGGWVSPFWSGQLDVHPNTSPLVFSRDGSLLAVNGNGVEAMVVDVAAGAVRTTLTVPEQRVGDVFSMDFSADGSELTMATWAVQGAAIRVWDVRTGRQTRVLEGAIATAVRHVPGGLLGAHPDLGMCGLDLVNGLTGCFKTPGYLTGYLGLSADGTRVALGMDDGSVTLWDLRAKALAGPILRGHTGGAAIAAAFSPDGSRIATGGRDGTVRLWDLGSGTEIGLPFRHSGDVVALSFGADGLRSVDAGGGVHFHPLTLDRAVGVVCARAGRALTPGERTAYDLPVAGFSC
ncbi:protein kinase [Nonomuraea sp. NPDC050556]|uniref:protein kinase domain-containing protein n=1 Tax=Nonomuraea sp. NPDC050556 TaxID=3364369 RepID=UPI0037B2B398